MLSEAELIKGCKNYNRAAQQELYMRFSPKMRGVCIRYTSNIEEAKDILQDGFIKVFSNIHLYAGTGSLEGWIRRVIVNTALSHYKKQKKHVHHHIEELREQDLMDETENDANQDENIEAIAFAKLSQEELIASLNTLPEPFRVVFNLYYMEEYSHKEIGELLSIDEKTSRTRLFRGRKSLQKHLEKLCKTKIHAEAHKK